MFGFCKKLGGLDLFGFIWIYLDLFVLLSFAFFLFIQLNINILYISQQIHLVFILIQSF